MSGSTFDTHLTAHGDVVMRPPMTVACATPDASIEFLDVDGIRMFAVECLNCGARVDNFAHLGAAKRMAFIHQGWRT